MKELQVVFESIRDIEQFVRAATGTVGGIRVMEGERSTNGKSLLGLTNLGLHRPLTVAFEGADTEYEAFEQRIAGYLA